jgi:phosphate acetyltransferase
MIAVYLCPTLHCPHLGQLGAGVLSHLAGRGGVVRVFRPIVAEAAGDPVLDALAEVAGEDPTAAWGATAEELLVNPTAAVGQVISRFRACADGADRVLVLGSEYDCSLAPVEFSWNTRIAANLGVPMVLVVPSDGGPGQTRARIDVALDEARRNLAQVLAVFVPTADAAIDVGPVGVPVHAVGDALPARSLAGALAALDAAPIGSAVVPARAGAVVVADMTLTNLLPQVRPDSVVVFSADRADIGVGLAVAGISGSFPFPAAALAAGPWPLADGVADVWSRAATPVPLRTAQPVEVARLAFAAHTAPGRMDAAAVAEAERDLRSAVDLDDLLAAAARGRSDVVTPLMFEHRLLEDARRADQHIVLPEGTEERVLRAADRLLAQGVCRLTLLGDEAAIRAQAAKLGLTLTGARIVDPETSDLRDRFAARYAELRAKKGVTLEQARERVADVSYFGTMMVLEGLADGMVSGAVNTTAHTIRPALEVIKTRPGISVVSSVFLMCLADRVLVFGDCAVNPNPTPEQVAEIAIASAATARQFGIEPRVAMLSYSTGSSGAGPDVEQTIEATRLVRERAPQLAVDGPLQYDAAVDPDVARTKMPDSPVAGKATVLIFPDLQTGNNTYKAVQRSSGALAIGPVLQGLNKPVNDLSRGALVSDIINTVAITAIQAGMESA